jgi:5S rRNA maturation endonuclease (ribonuclease M5)
VRLNLALLYQFKFTNMFKNAEEYLLSKSIAYKATSDGQEVQIQCLFCEDKKMHLYINNKDGCFYCQKCGSKGSWKNLMENLGDQDLSTLEAHKEYKESEIEYVVKLDTKKTYFDSNIIDKYCEDLPKRILDYLKSGKRGLSEDSIKKYKIGWNGSSISFPVYDNKGNIINIRHRRDPKMTKGEKYWNEKGGKASLYNIKVLEDKPEFVLICEGEFDAMIAEQFGFSSVSSTSGAGTFKEEWVKEFDNIENIYICYDTDEAGKEGALKVAALFKDKAKLVELPHEEGEKVDITDYFISLKHKASDFQKLLDKAKPVIIIEDFTLTTGSDNSSIHPSVDFINESLFYTFPLRIKSGDKISTELVVIGSGRKKAVVSNKKFKIDDIGYKLRNVAVIPGDVFRWNPVDIQKYLDGKLTITPSSVYIEIKETLNRFIDFNHEKDADIIALWIIGSYLFPAFDAYPYLYLVGVKRSGKTKTLLLIERLTFNAIMASDLTTSVLFRIVEAKRATVALDESEQLSDKTRKQDLRLILNSGYKRGAPAYRARKLKNGSFSLEVFEVYSPKAIANISGMDNVLEDRSLTFTMVRTNNKEKGNLAVTQKAEDWSYLRSIIYVFALENANRISEIYNDDPSVNELLNRQNELWRPLLSIAKVISDDLFTEINNEAKKRAEETSGADLEDFDSAVLYALKQLTSGETNISLTNKEIKEKAHEYVEEDQKEYLTSRGIGAALKRFGIKGKKVQGYWRYELNEEEINRLIKRYSVDV